MNRLEEIVAGKQPEIVSANERLPQLRTAAEARRDFRDFAGALKRSGRLRMIAEAKKASPSAGVIAAEYDPVQRAREYERLGADAVSILTERNFFEGDLTHLRTVRAQIALPVLRKDFVIDEAQIYESAAAGADAILLIVAALSAESLRRLHGCAVGIGLSVLVEIHAREEIGPALDAGAKIIGINNRDLTTFAVDLAVTENLLPELPGGLTVVSESGIRGVADLERLAAAPIDAVLVGEALMKAQPEELSRIFAGR